MSNLNFGDVLINGIRKNNKFTGNECTYVTGCC